MGHKYKIMRPEHSEHPELTGRQGGDKSEIMRPEHSEHPESYWETSGRQMGDKAARNTSPETNSKSSGPSIHPFKRSKNPSQVNLFGEKHILRKK